LKLQQIQTQGVDLGDERGNLLSAYHTRRSQVFIGGKLAKIAPRLKPASSITSRRWTQQQSTAT
jgi:hypothetical protein